ncbi:MAG: tryptophan 2,3-dioxygenase family protein [Bdellovibrionales bacterium]
MAGRYPKIHYHDYLALDKILNAQSPKSVEYNQPAHDETLFIVIHQVYELWFKQLLHEVTSVVETLNQEQVAESEMGLVTHRLSRMNEIFKLLIDQINILETMTPLDFLDFRDMLVPASGFQSFQFRQLETRLGLKAGQRLNYNSQSYLNSLKPDQAAIMQKLENSASLLECIEKWLERTPFLNVAGFDFWKSYATAVKEMFERDREIVANHKDLGPQDQERNLKIIAEAEKSFAALFDETAFKEAKKQGTWRMSFKAIHAALFIQVYRDQPVLQQPFRLLTALIDLDELMTNWRYRHALMAKRMLGSKIGTGGSSGYDYLKAATDQHRLFRDLNQLTTFFIPRSVLPSLTPGMTKELGFYYSTKES